MPTPAIAFADVPWDERYEVPGNKLVSIIGGPYFARRRVVTVISSKDGTVTRHVELIRCQVRPVGRYALDVALDGQPIARTIYVGRGDRVLIEPPATNGTITVVFDV